MNKPNYNPDIDTLIELLELNEDRLYAWLVEGSPTVVKGDLRESLDHVRELRSRVKAQCPEFVSRYETYLPL